MKPKKRKKAWTKMTTAELREATARFDKPLPESVFQNPSPSARQRWQRAKQNGFKSIFLGKKQTVVLKVDSEWLKRFDQYAADRGMTREELMERGLRSAMAFVS